MHCRCRATALGAFVLLLTVLGPTRAVAWGHDGHIIVAKIAELNLTEKTKQQVAKMLGPVSISHTRIANYADFVKHNGDFPQFAKSGPWHYVNLPVPTGKDDPDLDAFCKEGQCVIGQITRFQTVLADKTAKSDDRLEALIVLVHLVGDEQQPLHCADRKHDGGGNSLKVKFLGRGGNHLNLHSVWDDNLVQTAMGSLDAIDFANQLSAGI
jgi:S1/P1 Nuclease